MRRYSGVIFDIDGTLIDSNDAHARAWVRALGEGGFEARFEQVRPLIGMGGDQLLKHLYGLEKQDPRYKPLTERWKKHFMDDEVSGIRPQPGVRALIETLRGRGYKLVIGTSADEALVDRMLDIAGVKDLLTERATASDVEASKPEPDIVRAALEKLRLPPQEVVMVGDTPFDVESARKAGVPTLFLRCGGDERSEGAVGVFENPQDLLERLDVSPLREMREGEIVE